MNMNQLHIWNVELCTHGRLSGDLFCFWHSSSCEKFNVGTYTSCTYVHHTVSGMALVFERQNDFTTETHTEETTEVFSAHMQFQTNST